MAEILRYAAFTHDPQGGNPAGVVLNASGLSDSQMLKIAAQVGFSETAFITDHHHGGSSDDEASVPRLTVRYFSPEMEIDFCGHATVAAAVAYAQANEPGRVLFETQAGEIPVQVSKRGNQLRATLTSVQTLSTEVEQPILDRALNALGWDRRDLDLSLPPRVAFGGVHHLVLAVRTRERLADLSYDFEKLKDLMTEQGWITLQLVWRESENQFHVRDPFPVGGVVEDPATGAAAAAFGGYLRDLGKVATGARITLRQGEDMGRPSRLTVMPLADGRVQVSGAACRMPG